MKEKLDEARQPSDQPSRGPYLLANCKTVVENLYLKEGPEKTVE